MFLFFLHLSQGKKLIFSCSKVITGLMTVIWSLATGSSSNTQPCVAPEKWTESFFSKNMIIVGYQIDFFFWERIVKFVLMTVVKWDSEILMPFPSIMPSLCVIDIVSIYKTILSTLCKTLLSTTCGKTQDSCPARTYILIEVIQSHPLIHAYNTGK